MDHDVPSEIMTSNEETARESVWKRVYRNNKGAFLVLMAEVAGSSMDAIVRYVQINGRGMPAFQVIFARMSVTLVLSLLYLWWNQIPDFPLGRKSVRGLLLIRALFGFFGLWCLYYSVHYLPLAEATVFRFLVPIVTAGACALFLNTSFSRKDLIAGLLALVGVVIIAHPAAIFGSGPSSGRKDDAHVAPTQRLIAIAISILGVLGASGAYTMIRVIGDRAHALISVTYFAFISTAGSTLILLSSPSKGSRFVMPAGPREWALLSLLGVLGFILQFLLTAGLQLDTSPKATSMLYMQIVFALLFDFEIWGVLPGMWSRIGGMIVIGSTLWSALQKQKPGQKRGGMRDDARLEDAVVDEETALLGSSSSGEAVLRRGGVAAEND